MNIIKNKFNAVPYVVWMIIFTIVPLALIVWYAFTNSDGIFTLESFSQIGKYWSVFGKSINLAFISTIICLLIAYPVAYILSKIPTHAQNTFLLLLMLPMWMNFLLRTYAWVTLLENEGLINKFLGLFGIGPFEMINTSGAVVVGMVYNFLPFMILPLHSVMLKIDKSVIEAAQDLGANKLNVLVRVLIPLSLPGIVTGITMVFVPAVSTFVISRMLGGGSVYLIGDLIENQFLGAAYNPYMGSAISLVLMVIILLIMGIMNSVDGDMEEMLV